MMGYTTGLGYVTGTWSSSRWVGHAGSGTHLWAYRRQSKAHTCPEPPHRAPVSMSVNARQPVPPPTPTPDDALTGNAPARASTTNKLPVSVQGYSPTSGLFPFVSFLPFCLLFASKTSNVSFSFLQVRQQNLSSSDFENRRC